MSASAHGQDVSVRRVDWGETSPLSVCIRSKQKSSDSGVNQGHSSTFLNKSVLKNWTLILIDDGNDSLMERPASCLMENA